MEKKDYLKQYVNATRKINALVDDLSQLGALSAKIRSARSPMATPYGDRIDSVFSQIADMEKELDAEVKILKAVKTDVKKRIEDVSDEQQKTVLYRRYILGETWESIANEMNLSYQWVCGLHAKALQKIKPLDGNLHNEHDRV